MGWLVVWRDGMVGGMVLGWLCRVVEEEVEVEEVVVSVDFDPFTRPETRIA